MILTIKNTATIDEVQQNFNLNYRYLKIVFFKKPHQKEEGSYNKYRYPQGVLIGDIRKKGESDEIEITGEQKTAEVEHNFERLFGLYIQVYRKAGIEWVQTIGSDDLSIDQQNEIGKNSTTNIIHPELKPKLN